MKIIKRGRSVRERSTEWNCQACNSTIEAKRSEGEFFSDQRDGDAIIFVCPVCDEKNYIDITKFK